MSVYVDSSALLAILNDRDPNHAPARRTWESLIARDEDLLCTNYVVVECFSVIQRRLGMAAVRELAENLLPLLRVHWVTPAEHYVSASAVLTADRRQLSLVDCVSFETMRREAVTEAFAFDLHFAEQGFRLAG